MTSVYEAKDHEWIKELTQYPKVLSEQLSYFKDTSEIPIPEDPIEQVIFQDRAKAAIRQIAHNRGHILMVGMPGTGKSMLANMFNEIVDRSMGEYLRPKDSIVAYPGKDKNYIRIAYEKPDVIDDEITKINEAIHSAQDNVEAFSLADLIHSTRRVKIGLIWAAVASAVAGIFFPPAFVVTGLTGMGAIFMYIQENSHKVQEKIQQENNQIQNNEIKHLQDIVPEILYDPRRDKALMTRISEPDSRNMKGGFRHDPYQSGLLHTPAHKRAYLGAHAKSPIIYIDELKAMVKAGYIPDLLEIMQNKTYVLEGGKNSGSGAADRSENRLKAENIIIACCNHDTLRYLQEENDGAFLSRIEDKGKIVYLKSAIPESLETNKQVAQYIRQEIVNLEKEFQEVWSDVLEKEGYEGVRKRSEKIFGKRLPRDYTLTVREFSRNAVLEIIKELRCRASDKKLSSMLRPINGIIKTAEYKAILNNSTLVEPEHVREAIEEHLGLEGAIYREVIKNKKDLKRYIGSMTDSIGYVVGLAVIQSRSSGRMIGQPLPIHCQINTGTSDTVAAPGKIGDIAKAASQNVRASIKKVLNNIGATYVGYEMHVEYIQAHDGVEGDSASVAMDIALISDFIKQSVNQKYGVTGSLTGDIMLAVGGVTEKIRSIMDRTLGMEGACIPWQNKYDIEPLLINAEFEYIKEDNIPGIRIFRTDKRKDPFDIYFCKTKYHAYKILMGLDKNEVEKRMVERSNKDSLFIKSMNGT